MTARLFTPIGLGTDVMEGHRYEFMGHPVPDEMLPTFANNLVLFDTLYRTLVVRQRTQDKRCTCGRPVPVSSSCGCCCAEHDQ